MHRLEIALLGGFSVVRNGLPVTTFESDQVRSLLVYLAATPGGPHPRSVLADLLWPGYTDSAARANLRHALSRLRRALGDSDPARPLVRADSHSVELAAADDIDVDVAAFAAALAACQAHAHDPQAPCSACEARLRAAAERYRGPLLAAQSLSRSPVFEEWRQQRRAALEQQATEVFGRLAGIAERAGDHAEARQWAERQLAIDPWHEESHARLLRALAGLGEGAAALAHYRRYCEALAVELGGAPSAQLAALAARLRDGAPTPHLHLPAPPTPFVGRQAELARVAAQLRPGGPRLLTLVGPGGVGKTRLALAAAARAADAFPDGVWFVDCAQLRDPQGIPGQIAAALNLPELPIYQPLAALAAHLGQRRVLLLLDNLEQIPAAGVPLDGLLRATPNLALLATSRVPLGGPAEALVRVAPMGLPAPQAPLPPGELSQYDGLNLFALRGQAARPGFMVDATCREAVVAICQRLDGLPLALELAAARLRLLSPAALLDRLSRPLEIIGGTNHPLRPQQTLRATIRWSYDLLDEAARSLFRQLSIFEGSWTAETAAAVCSLPGGQPAILDALDRLLDSSLVQPALATASAAAEPRLQLLAVIREFATEQRDAYGPWSSLGDAHADHFCGLVARAAIELRGPRHLAWLETIEAEYGNLQTAFSWLLGGEQADRARRLAADLWFYWVRRERPNDGCAWLEAALASAGGADPATHTRSRACLAYLLFRRGELARAETIAQDALAAFEALGDGAGAAFATLVLAHVACHRSEGPRAIALYEQSLAGFRRAGEPFWVAWVLLDLSHLYREADLARVEDLLEESEALISRHGMTYARSAVLVARGLALAVHGHLARAEVLLEESRQECRRHGENDAWPLLLLGETAAARGDLRRAQALLRESLASYEEVGVHKGIALATAHLGWVTLAAGELTPAAGLLERGRKLCSDLGDMWGVALCLCGLGWQALAEGDLRWAGHVLGRSLALYQKVDRKKALGECLHGLAALAFLERGDALAAARLLGAAAATRGGLEVPMAPLAPALRAELAAFVAESLGAAGLAEATAEGGRWNLPRLAQGLMVEELAGEQ